MAGVDPSTHLRKSRTFSEKHALGTASALLPKSHPFASEVSSPMAFEINFFLSRVYCGFLGAFHMRNLLGIYKAQESACSQLFHA
jgi:hypothetical protein